MNTISRCPLHKADHSLNVCISFRAKPIQERKNILFENGFCYKYFSSKHLSRDCKATIKCVLCWNSRHTTAMHPDSDQEHNSSSATGFKVDGGEKKISTKFLLNLQWIVNVLNSVDKLSVEDFVLKLFQFVRIFPERKNILSRCTLL